MAFQNHGQFIVEGPRPVMRFLIVDVGMNLLDVRLADGERGVAGLPCEIAAGGEGFVQPFQGVGLDCAHGVGDGMRGTQRTK